MKNLSLWVCMLVLCGLGQALASGQTITPSPYWKNQIAFPYDRFCPSGTREGVVIGGVTWVKFMILLKPYDPNVVYFQDSRRYAFHYSFAAEQLDPFLGMGTQQFNAVTLFERNQQAILGTVILPPATTFPYEEPQFPEYGIQFVRQDPYTPEEIRDLFHLVKANVTAPPDVQAFYFPTYEQQAVAAAHRDWFESQGVPLSSTARWAKGNTCYSPGWAFGRVKFVTGDNISSAYHSGLLQPGDVLLTDGVPAEVPFVAGIMSLAPSTPNSHVAILARTYGVPFVHLALASDAQRAQELIGHRIILSAYESYGTCDTRLIDTEGLFDDATAAQLLELKRPSPLQIAPTTPLGAFGISTEGLLPSDIRYVGGKAANFGILREAVPENSPSAIALSFELWNAFLDQPLGPAPSIDLGSGEHILFWADDDEDQGPTHTSFRLSRSGESIGLFDIDGITPIDTITFGPQASDISWGRSVDGGDTWESFLVPTPGQPNSTVGPGSSHGLVINELMADNETTIEDPCEAGEYPDWIELYNASDSPITLNGMYLTDDVNDPTMWQVPPAVTGATLREEIAWRLSAYDSYPPADMQRLARDLASIRNLFRNPTVTWFDDALHDAVIAVLTDPQYGFDPTAMLRFRSSTNVEDSEDFIGAGLYDSFSGCLADDIDNDNGGPCACDPNKDTERSVFRAIRRVFASFYNDNAYLERLRHDVSEAEVGMAVLVHHSFPDDIELANGVATVEWKGRSENSIVTMVSQAGAISVTNPEGGSTPEEVVVTILPSGSIVEPKLQRPSSLIPLGATVMEWRGDYTDLTDLLIRVSDTFREITEKTTYVLDLEYKKVAVGSSVLPAGGLVVKQVREVPTPQQTQTPFLVNVPLELEVFTGEFDLFEATDVLADHRLKSRWRLETHNMILDSNTLAEQLYTNVQIECLDGDRIRTISGQMSLLPSATHSFDGEDAIDNWQLRDLENPRTCHLRTTDVPTGVPASQSPILMLGDLGTHGFNVPFKCLTLDVEYDRAVPSWFRQSNATGNPSDTRLTMRNRVRLWPCLPPRDDDLFEERTFSSNGVSVSTSFYYPAPPEGASDWVAGAGATAPLKRWEQTIIEGLTTEPIVLQGYYSQTYRPEHHNLVEHFLFEPRLEPGISAEIVDQLRDQNIRLIHLILDHTSDGDQSRIVTYGFDE